MEETITRFTVPVVYYIVFYSLYFTIPLQLLRSLLAWDEADISVIKTVGKVAKEALCNERGHFTAQGLRMNGCDNEEIPDSTSAGWSWYFYRRTVGIGLSRWLQPRMFFAPWPLPSTERQLTYGKPLIDLIREIFQKRSNDHHERYMDRGNVEHNCWSPCKDCTSPIQCFALPQQLQISSGEGGSGVGVCKEFAQN